ncbi:MAG: copper resistance protein CopC [Thermoleophilia bacterium]|nr:copper resistance protein CopC [Thermoleophilia bacterium]
MLAVFAVTPVTSAFAHATLDSIVPGDEATVATGVKSVDLKFNERVSVAFGGTKVWGPDGRRVDSGAARIRGHVVQVPIASTARGTYAVSYRIVSADGHPVHGASTFHVGQASVNDISQRKALAASQGHPGLERTFGAVRGVALLALMLLAGGAAFAFVVAPGTRPRGWGWAIAVALVALPLSYALDASISAGFTIGESLRWPVLRAEAGAAWGRSALVQLALLVLVAVWMSCIDRTRVRARGDALAASIPAFLPLIAWATGGHALATNPVWLRLPLDMLHMCVAAIWIGGLVQLLAYLRAGAVSMEHVLRWSRTAFACVVVLVTTGLYASYVEIGLSKTALVDTTYGRLVLVKALLLVATMPFAWLNMRHNVPGLRSGRTSAGVDARARLRTYVIAELLVLGCVIAATAALIQTAPARTQIAPARIERTIKFPSGASAQLIVDPATVGPNEIHIYAYNSTQRVDTKVTDISLTADGPRGIKHLTLGLLPGGPGHFTVASRTIPFAGSWKFSLTVDRGDFESESGAVTAKIGVRQ